MPWLLNYDLWILYCDFWSCEFQSAQELRARLLHVVAPSNWMDSILQLSVGLTQAGFFLHKTKSHSIFIYFNPFALHQFSISNRIHSCFITFAYNQVISLQEENGAYKEHELAWSSLTILLIGRQISNRSDTACQDSLIVLLYRLIINH